MEEILKIIAIGIIGVILSLLLAEKSTVFATITVIITTITIVFMSISLIDELISNLNFIISSYGVDFDIFVPVMKVCVIAIVVKISSDICKDAGYSAISSKIQFAGSITSVIMIFPLFLRVIEILKEVL